MSFELRCSEVRELLNEDLRLLRLSSFRMPVDGRPVDGRLVGSIGGAVFCVDVAVCVDVADAGDVGVRKLSLRGACQRFS